MPIAIGPAVMRVSDLPYFAPYAGLVHGWSLRALPLIDPNGLVTFYAGPVVSLMRSGDGAVRGFTASEITNGTAAAWVGAGDAPVMTWYDQIGGKPIIASSAGSAPKLFVAGALQTRAGRPVVAFDGANDALVGMINLPQPLTVSAIGAGARNGDQSAFVFEARGLDNANGATQQKLSLLTYLSGPPVFYAGTAPINGTQAIDQGEAFWLGAVANGAASSFRTDRDGPVGGNPGTAGMGQLYVGSSSNPNSFTAVRLHELLAWGAAVPDDTLTAARDDQMRAWVV